MRGSSLMALEVSRKKLSYFKINNNQMVVFQNNWQKAASYNTVLANLEHL
jgi:hypothetical protein